jgi:hypothetical protein
MTFRHRRIVGVRRLLQRQSTRGSIADWLRRQGFGSWSLAVGGDAIFRKVNQCVTDGDECVCLGDGEESVVFAFAADFADELVGCCEVAGCNVSVRWLVGHGVVLSLLSAV